MGLYHYYVSVPFYELGEGEKAKVGKFNNKMWENKDCDKEFVELIKKTSLILDDGHHKEMASIRKVKDIWEDLKGSSSTIPRELVYDRLNS